MTWEPKYRGLQNNWRRNSFETKLKTFKRDAHKGTSKYFPNWQKHMTDVEIYDKLDVHHSQFWHAPS